MKILILFLFLTLFFSNIANATNTDKETYAAVLKASQSNYIDPVSVEKVAVLSLKELHSVDQNIMIGDDSRYISLYNKSRLVKSYPKPNPDDLNSWVNLSFIVIKDAKRSSKIIAENEHILFDSLMSEAFKKMGNDSKYYRNIEEGEEGEYKDKRIDDVLYIKVPDFNQTTKDRILGSIKKSKNKFDGLIIDLRSNRGGMLSEAVDVVDLFLDEGIITSTTGHNGEDVRFYMSAPGDTIENRPIVVLVDGSSASSSEIFAACLQDQGRAKIVGSSTFGKGTVQTLLSLPNDSYLAITNAKFYRPSGEEIDKKGVIPDICTVDDTAVDMKDLAKNISECPRQDRHDSDFDIKTAVKLIKDNY